MKAIVEFKNVSKTFKRVTGEEIHSLKDIDLEIYPGEIVSIIGTNGAGKSTLFNCLTGQIPITSGEIIIGDKSIKDYKSNELAAQIGRVFQDPTMGTAPRMTVMENLMLAAKRGEKRGWGISLTKENEEMVKKEVEKFRLGIEDRLNVEIGSLSGGQRQTVSLLMATMKSPKILLLDEHTAALDPRTQRDVMEITEEVIKENNLTALMITHSLQDAFDYSDRMVLMHSGRIEKIYNRSEIDALTPAKIFEKLEELSMQELEKL